MPGSIVSVYDATATHQLSIIIIKDVNVSDTQNLKRKIKMRKSHVRL